MWTQISFVTIYAVQFQNLLFYNLRCFVANLYCRDLRAFAWRKVETKNCVCGEKRKNVRYEDEQCKVVQGSEKGSAIREQSIA